MPAKKILKKSQISLFLLIANFQKPLSEKYDHYLSFLLNPFHFKNADVNNVQWLKEYPPKYYFNHSHIRLGKG